MKDSCYKKYIIFGIIVLLIGLSVVSSAGNILKDVSAYNYPRELLSCDHLAYVGGYGDLCGLYEFILNDPGNLTCVCPGGASGSFISGSTWTNDGRWLGCEYGSGILWEFDLETCDMSCIGGGGTGCNGLAWDPE